MSVSQRFRVADDAGDPGNVGTQFVIEIVDRLVHRKHGKVRIDAAMIIDDQSDRRLAHAQIMHVGNRAALRRAPL